jgi:hypothetical protein
LDKNEKNRQAILAKIKSLGTNQELFAADCAIGASSLQKFLSGRTAELSANHKTRIDNRHALGLMAMGQVSRKELGSYSRQAAEEDIAGTYTTIRTSADKPNSYYVFRTEISWDDDAECLKFIEKFRQDPHHHQGEIAVFTYANILYFISSSRRGHGYRLITVYRKITTGKMSGFLVSSYENDHQFVPIVAPIIYVKGDLKIANGMIRSGDTDFDFCETEIAKSLKNGPSKLLLPDAFLPEFRGHNTEFRGHNTN